jgi:hypothetical protein
MIPGMNKLNEDERVKVEISKGAISKLREAEDLIYANLVKEVGIDNNWLYDYIFNCDTNDNDVYTTMVRNNIFK